MRNMAFSMTTQQFRDRTKDVTRRFGLSWFKLKPGDCVCGVEKGMGLKKGETVNRLGVIEIVSVTSERADAIEHYEDPQREVHREGFPDLAPGAFVQMLCTANRKQPDDICCRIEYKYVQDD